MDSNDRSHIDIVIGYNYVNLYCYSPDQVRNDEANRKIIHHYIHVNQNKRPIIVDTKVKYIPEGQYKGSNAKNSNNNKKEKKPNKTRTAAETPRKSEINM